jgi:hypothetical protein
MQKGAFAPSMINKLMGLASHYQRSTEYFEALNFRGFLFNHFQQNLMLIVLTLPLFLFLDKHVLNFS